MKSILAIAMVLLFCVSIDAQEIRVLAPHFTTTPAADLQPPTTPPKPIFGTPIRDGFWYWNQYTKQWIWYNRYYRYKRLEGMLQNPQPQRRYYYSRPVQDDCLPGSS
jgi:hypothetical protein